MCKGWNREGFFYVKKECSDIIGEGVVGRESEVRVIGLIRAKETQQNENGKTMYRGVEDMIKKLGALGIKEAGVKGYGVEVPDIVTRTLEYHSRGTNFSSVLYGEGEYPERNMPRGIHTSKRQSGFQQRKAKKAKMDEIQSMYGSLFKYVTKADSGQSLSKVPESPADESNDSHLGDSHSDSNIDNTESMKTTQDLDGIKINNENDAVNATFGNSISFWTNSYLLVILFYCQ
ncbi:hypothetical protein FQA39_LY18495 [Lamprigera yunnana]|nr:hypothetical protein FQA39_LY18495 [Lamprigera yunnana]